MNLTLDDEDAGAAGRRNSVERLRPAPSYTHPVTFHYTIQQHTTRTQRLMNAFKVYRLTVMTLVSVCVGLIVGLICRPYAKDWTERHFMYIEMPGELYLRLLKLTIIPLLVSNVVLSFGTIQGRLTSHLGKLAAALYVSSNTIALVVAVLVALIICPGKHVEDAANGGTSAAAAAMFASSNPSSTTTTTTTTTTTIETNIIRMDTHHYFNEYHDSVKRYREYHPMFYHTDRGEHQDATYALYSRAYLVRNKRTLEPNRTATQTRRNDDLPLLLTPSNRNAPNFLSTAQDDQQSGYRYFDASLDDDDDNDDDDDEDDVDDIGEPNSSHVHTGALEEPNSHLSQQPNHHASADIQRIGLSTKLPIDVLLDVLRNLVPDNAMGATMQQTRTRLFAPKEVIIGKLGQADPPASRWPMGHELVNEPNIIGLLALSVLTGVVLSQMDEASRPMLDLCSCIAELSLRIGMFAINLAPVCIMFLLIGQVARARDLSSMAGELFMYSLTVVVALIIHGFVLLPLAYYAITRKSPLEFLVNLFEVLVASFATSSSSATMPLMLNKLDDMQLNPVIVRAFGPLSCVFNMNGTAIYEAVGAIFIAQTLGRALSLTSVLLVGVSAALASLSTAGVPSAGLMTMVIVLNAINLPVLQLSFIYIVDFIMDRFRTVINVWSSALVCALIDHICPEHLFEEEMKPEKYREMLKYRQSRGSIQVRKGSMQTTKQPSEDNAAQAHTQEQPQVISVTITPPPASERVAPPPSHMAYTRQNSNNLSTLL